MFCYQCEQAAKGTGCDTMGVCGKKPETAALQDVILYQLKGIGYLAHLARQHGAVDSEIDRYTVEALFTTVTNVDFDPARLVEWIARGEQMRQRAAQMLHESGTAAGHSTDESEWPPAARYVPKTIVDELVGEAAVIEGIGVLAGPQSDDVRSLQQLLTYGLKGMAAYADHALLLGKTDQAVFAFFHEALAKLNDHSATVEDLVALNMRCGSVNIRTMELLDEGHTERFGHPEPTAVSTGTKAGPAIIVSGHDLLDLEALLQQTDGTGVNVYTHGEMLPAHGYPGLKKCKHLAGHFGTAWQNQQREFDMVPAAVLFTTNCIQKPRDSYADRVFTTGLVAWPGIQHAPEREFSAVIEKAKALGGFEEQPGGTLTVGFARNAVLGVADTVIDAVKNGAIKHFFLVGGCDGAKPGRNYYTEFVEKTPPDTVVLTLACGKFRFNHLDLGDIGGIPRLLDVGQCNDAYSAVKIAQALAQAFDCGLNELPLSLVLSWYEQKAVVILLSLLSLGVKGIRLGPTLPAFVTPNILDFLVKEFDIKPVGEPEEDLQAILGT
ncbi:MAG: hydroxylamine reductase [Chitinivibrionales bacterium]|nr:hydroxylamine reductase [Chitinivibrionales bacterium]